MKTVTDYHGHPIDVGDQVRAWDEGSGAFTATVSAIGPHRPGDGEFYPVVLVRDDDQSEIERDSDQMEVIW
jgi:hypothetical protein